GARAHRDPAISGDPEYATASSRERRSPIGAGRSARICQPALRDREERLGGLLHSLQRRGQPESRKKGEKHARRPRTGLNSPTGHGRWEATFFVQSKARL